MLNASIFSPSLREAAVRGGMNEMAFRSLVMRRAWLAAELSLSSPCRSQPCRASALTAAGVKVALLSPPSAAPRRPVTFPRRGQQHPTKPLWELLRTVQCHIEDRCNITSFPPVCEKCCELVGQSKLGR